MTSNNSGYITTKQAAKLSGYTKDYVGQLARKGHLETKKSGRERLVKTSDLFKYVALKSESEKTAIHNKVSKPIVSVSKVKNDRPLTSKQDSSSIVTKKIISPWVQEMSPIKAKADNATFVKSDVQAVRTKVTPAFSAKPYNDKPVESPILNNWLPMISTTAVAIAMVIFMFSVTQTATNLAANQQGLQSGYLASVGDLEFMDQVSVGWFNLVNQSL